MIATKSPLFLKRFDILNCKCNMVPSADPNIDLLATTNEMPVDIDYAIKKYEGGQYYIFVKVAINAADNPQPGYSVMAEGVGAFDFEEALPQEEKKRLLSSGVNICITNLRSYINTMTSFYPLGRFSFHSIDMPSLFKSKNQSLNEKE